MTLYNETDLSDKTVYTVLFNTCMFGNLILFFMSKHKDFCPLTLYIRKDEQNDTYNSEEAVVHAALNDYEHCDADYNQLPQDVLRNVNKMRRKYSKFYKNYVVKVLPHFYDIGVESLQYADLNLKVIVLFTEYTDMYNDRLTANKVHVDIETMTAAYNYIKPKLEQVLDCVFIDPFKLLYDKDDTEYDKLCAWANIEPLLNWKEVIDKQLSIIDGITYDK